MKVAEERRNIEAILNRYREKLDTIDESKFTETPLIGGWSYAEVYSHTMQATLGATLAIERCTQLSCYPTNKKTNILGKLVFFFGRLPPVKIKQPKKIAEKMPALKISKEEARNLIIKCRKRLDNMVAVIKKAENDGRVAHPRLGMLSAGQWLKFIGIHLNHHLKQLKRIDKCLAKK